MIASPGSSGYRRILVGVDFSASTPGVLELAGALARAFDSRLEVVHVLVLNEADPAAAQTELERCVPASLDALVASRRLTRALSGDLGLLAAARESRADLIVVGTHGRSGFAHVLLGSVAERVVQLAECPVLTYRRPEHRFRRP